MVCLVESHGAAGLVSALMVFSVAVSKASSGGVEEMPDSTSVYSFYNGQQVVVTTDFTSLRDDVEDVAGQDLTRALGAVAGRVGFVLHVAQSDRVALISDGIGWLPLKALIPLEYEELPTAESTSDGPTIDSDISRAVQLDDVEIAEQEPDAWLDEEFHRNSIASQGYGQEHTLNNSTRAILNSSRFHSSADYESMDPDEEEPLQSHRQLDEEDAEREQVDEDADDGSDDEDERRMEGRGPTYEVSMELKMTLPPGVNAPDLFCDLSFRSQVKKQVAGALVLPSGRLRLAEVVLDMIEILEDTNAFGENGHGTVVYGKKWIRCTTTVTAGSVLFNVALDNLVEKSLPDERLRPNPLHSTLPRVRMTGDEQWRYLVVDESNDPTSRRRNQIKVQYCGATYSERREKYPYCLDSTCRSPYCANETENCPLNSTRPNANEPEATSRRLNREEM